MNWLTSLAEANGEVLFRFAACKYSQPGQCLLLSCDRSLGFGATGAAERAAQQSVQLLVPLPETLLTHDGPSLEVDSFAV